jgi:hypothetical protein
VQGIRPSGGASGSSSSASATPIRPWEDEDPVDLGVAIEGGDELDELRLSDVGRELVVDRADSGRLAGLALVGDVDMGGGIVADEHRGEAGLALRLGDHVGDPLLEVGRNGLAVDDLSH